MMAGGLVATKAFDAFWFITSSTARHAPPAPRNAASKLPGDIVVSASMRTMPSDGEALRISWKYSSGCTSVISSSVAIGACSRIRIWKRSSSKACSTARMRSGRSGWPGGVWWSMQAGCEIRSVDIFIM